MTLFVYVANSFQVYVLSIRKNWLYTHPW